MGIKVDFTGVETREFEPLPIARYPVSVTAAPVQQGGESGADYVAWEFTVQGGEYDGRKGWLNTSLLPQSLWATKRVLLALGVPEEEVEGEIEDMEAFLEALIGREGIMVVGHRKWQGETRQDVRRILPSEGEGESAEAQPF